MPIFKMLTVALCVALGQVSYVGAARAEEAGDGPKPATALGFEVKTITGETVNLQEVYGGRVVLVVNTASKCGFTKQYAGLESLYKQHQDEGLVILGFPCNQFKNQEPGTEEEIAAFCEKNYGVTFPLFAKVDVNGDSAAPLFAFLTREALPRDQQGPVKWNFEKFLIGRDGRVIARFASSVTPESDKLREAITAALAVSQPTADETAGE